MCLQLAMHSSVSCELSMHVSLGIMFPRTYITVLQVIVIYVSPGIVSPPPLHRFTVIANY